MKRILIAAIIAVGIHGLILNMEFDRISVKPSGSLKSSIVTMTLVSMPPKKAESKLPAIARHISGIKKEKEKNKEKEKKKAAVKATRQKKVEKSSGAATDDKKKKKEVADPKTKADNIQPEIVEKQDDFAAEQAGGVSGTQELGTVRGAMPIYDKNPSPEYPLIARRRGFQGTVVLEVLVNRNGRVGDLRVFNSSGYKVLDRSAVESVREWIFRPAIKGNENIEMWVRVPVCFQLK